MLGIEAISRGMTHYQFRIIAHQTMPDELDAPSVRFRRHDDNSVCILLAALARNLQQFFLGIRNLTA
jgi:hypothetical protein